MPSQNKLLRSTPILPPTKKYKAGRPAPMPCQNSQTHVNLVGAHGLRWARERLCEHHRIGRCGLPIIAAAHLTVAAEKASAFPDMLPIIVVALHFVKPKICRGQDCTFPKLILDYCRYTGSNDLSAASPISPGKSGALSSTIASKQASSCVVKWPSEARPSRAIRCGPSPTLA